jgi:DNA-binding YbaB/EbfC family protein
MNVPPNLGKMLEQAQKMQEDMAAAQDKLRDEKVEASSGGGMVKVVATGEGRLESLAIDPDAVDPEDVELLQDMVLAAVNEALRQADDLREKAMGDTAGFDPMEALSGLGLGGLAGGGGGGGGLPGGMPPGGGGNRAARRAGKKKR